jgi:hypothetical protein
VRCARDVVGLGERVDDFVVEIEAECRFVDLHPLCAGGGEVGENRFVHADQSREHRGDGGVRPALFGEREERDRPEEHGTGRDADRFGLAELGDRLGARVFETLTGRELGDDVVIVGVEPLGHLEWGDSPAAEVAAACHREVRAKIDFAALGAVPVGYRADHRGGVEHVVIEREVVRRNVIEAELALAAPTLTAQ